VQVSYEDLQHDTLSVIPELNAIHTELCDWSWRFGETPHFEISYETRFAWGIMNVNINSARGRIKDIQIFSDSLYPEMITSLTNHLQGMCV
jgi:lipoate---protein ligase